MRLNFRFNNDDQLPNRHMFVCGGTGSGKSTVLNIDKEINAAKCIVAWDPDRSHVQTDDKKNRLVKAGNAAHSVKAFRDNLVKALQSGGKFRLACCVPNTKELFQAFCAVIVRHAASETPITVLIEEVHQVTGNVEATGYWSDLLTRGRKYGVRLVVISPKPQRCDKDTISSCFIKIACALDSHADRAAIAANLGDIGFDDIRKMAQLNIPEKKIHWYRGEGGATATMQSHTFPD